MSEKIHYNESISGRYTSLAFCMNNDNYGRGRQTQDKTKVTCLNCLKILQKREQTKQEVI